MRRALIVPFAAGCADAACPLALPSTCAAPTQAADVYVDQASRYFDSLDASADPASRPTYAPGVVRWEWPPWLLLTGLGADLTEASDRLVLAAQPDTTVPERDCRAFDAQPFARCRVVMSIEGRPCPIYEEFTFDPDGRLTFVEAWSDLPGLGPADPWGEPDAVERLSTRVPGLATGTFDPTSPATLASRDPDVQDLVARSRDFWGAWAETYQAAGDALYADGCGW